MRILRAVFSFEALFVLFLNAGRVKAALIDTAMPVDLTVVLLALCVAGGGAIVLWRMGSGVVMDWGTLRHPTLLAMGAFFLYGVARGVWSTPDERATYLTQVYGGILPVAYVGAAVVIATDLNRIRRFLTCIALAAFVMVGGTYYLLARGLLSFSVGASIFQSNYIAVGTMIGMGVLCLLGAVARRRHPLTTALLVLLVPIAGVPMYLLGGRGALLSLGLAMMVGASGVITVSLTGRIRSKRGARLPATMLAFAACAFVLLLVTQTNAMTVDRIMVLFRSEGPGASANARFYLAQLALNAFWDHPVFGVGLGGFANLTGVSSVNLYPHSLPLEVLAELGLVGLTLLMAAVLGSWAVLRERRQDTPPEIHDTIRMLAVFWAINALVGGSIENSAWTFAILGLMPLPRRRHHERIAMTV